MYSSFRVSKTQCMTCNNEVLKQLGTLRGVFAAEIDRVNGYIVVNHTDEISREAIKAKLAELDWHEIQDDEPETDEPSIWGCAL